jgi:hypothetical protein
MNKHAVTSLNIDTRLANRWNSDGSSDDTLQQKHRGLANHWYSDGHTAMPFDTTAMDPTGTAAKFEHPFSDWFYWGYYEEEIKNCY